MVPLNGLADDGLRHRRERDRTPGVFVLAFRDRSVRIYRATDEENAPLDVFLTDAETLTRTV